MCLHEFVCMTKKQTKKTQGPILHLQGFKGRAMSAQVADHEERKQPISSKETLKLLVRYS